MLPAERRRALRRRIAEARTHQRPHRSSRALARGQAQAARRWSSVGEWRVWWTSDRARVPSREFRSASCLRLGRPATTLAAAAAQLGGGIQRVSNQAGESCDRSGLHDRGRQSFELTVVIRLRRHVSTAIRVVTDGSSSSVISRSSSSGSGLLASPPCVNGRRGRHLFGRNAASQGGEPRSALTAGRRLVSRRPPFLHGQLDVGSRTGEEPARLPETLIVLALHGSVARVRARRRSVRRCDDRAGDEPGD